MGREALEGLRVSPKPAASREINKWITSHPVTPPTIADVIYVCPLARSGVEGREHVTLRLSHFGAASSTQ